MVVPVLLCGLLSRVFSVGYKTQYVIYAEIPLLLLLGIGLGRFIHSWSTRTAFVFLCVLFAISLYNRRYDPGYQVEDTRALGSFLSQRSNYSKTVFVMADYMVSPVRYYLGDGWNVLPIPSVDIKGENLDRALGCMSESAQEGSPYWLVYARAFHSDPGHFLRRALVQNGAIKHETDFAGIER